MREVDCQMRKVQPIDGRAVRIQSARERELHARAQLFDAERFRQIVIGTFFERGDFFGLVAAR